MGVLWGPLGGTLIVYERKQGIRDLSKVTRSSQTKVLLEEEANASSSFSPGLFFCRQLMLHGCNGGKYEGTVSLYGPSF